MPQTLNSPANILNGVDYFKAKLQFENTPHGLNEIKDKDSVLVLDVRDRDSYEQEHIPGAANIPLEELEERITEVPKQKTVVAYCWTVTCALAPKAALILAHKDYKVQEMVGGIEAWKKAGFPVEGRRA